MVFLASASKQYFGITLLLIGGSPIEGEFLLGPDFPRGPGLKKKGPDPLKRKFTQR